MYITSYCPMIISWYYNMNKPQRYYTHWVMISCIYLPVPINPYNYEFYHAFISSLFEKYFNNSMREYEKVQFYKSLRH